MFHKLSSLAFQGNAFAFRWVVEIALEHPQLLAAHDPAERFPNEAQNGIWAGPGITKMIQEHMLLIQKYPNRKLKSYYRDFDRSFDPELSPVYKSKKQVDW